MEASDNLRRLVFESERAHAEGRSPDALRLLTEAQKVAPDHPLVLNAAALQAIHNGDTTSARTLLERSVARDPDQTGPWLNLATVFRRLGLRAEERKALESVLRLEPRHLLALLQKGSLLEMQGERRTAATTYRNALQTIPKGANFPEHVQRAIAHASSVVRENDDAFASFLDDRMRATRERHAGAELARFDHCRDALVGRRRIYECEPTLLKFPKLPAIEYFERSLFPWLADIEAASAEIRQEFERVFAESADELTPYIAYPDGVPLDQWAELNHSRKWSVYHLWRDGKPVDEHVRRCPRTAEVLSKIPRVDIPGVGPTAFFSILDAKSHIPPHTGVTNTRSIVHVPLVIPGQCRFRVGSETRDWRFGEAWVFDDTIEHEAWNDSAVPRAILIFDVWNPLLSAAERDLVRDTVAGFAEYYGHGSPYGEDT